MSRIREVDLDQDHLVWVQCPECFRPVRINMGKPWRDGDRIVADASWVNGVLLHVRSCPG